MSTTGKLHGLLAVENDIKTKFNVSKDSSVGKFNKGELFNETVVKKTLKSDDDVRPPEIMAMTTTVCDVLNTHASSFSRLIDHQYQKEISNTTAKADITLDDGTIVISDAPVGFIISMLKNLEKEFEMIKVIPTLQQGVIWEKYDSHRFSNVYRNVNTIRDDITKEVKEWIVVTQATPEHEAQIRDIVTTKVIGHKEKSFFSSMIPQSVKRDLIERCESLISACKKAMKRANDTEHPKDSVSSNIIKYLYKDLV